MNFFYLTIFSNKYANIRVYFFVPQVYHFRFPSFNLSSPFLFISSRSNSSSFTTTLPLFIRHPLLPSLHEISCSLSFSRYLSPSSLSVRSGGMGCVMSISPLCWITNSPLCFSWWPLPTYSQRADSSRRPRGASRRAPGELALEP